jgi:hypothetical protein
MDFNFLHPQFQDVCAFGSLILELNSGFAKNKYSIN